MITDVTPFSDGSSDVAM